MSEQISRVYKRRSIPTSVRAEVWDSSGGTCYHCGKALHPISDFHVDHLVPVAKGGTDTRDNLVASCQRCNRRKATKASPFSPRELRTQTRVPPQGYAGVAIVRQWLGITLNDANQLVAEGRLKEWRLPGHEHRRLFEMDEVIEIGDFVSSE